MVKKYLVFSTAFNKKAKNFATFSVSEKSTTSGSIETKTLLANNWLQQDHIDIHFLAFFWGGRFEGNAF